MDNRKNQKLYTIEIQRIIPPLVKNLKFVRKFRKIS